jgi:coatomer protein complex subunit gamma
VQLSDKYILNQASSVVSAERFFKSAIVDRNPSVSSAAIVSAYHLHPVAKDVIRRWANETQEAANGKAGSSGGLYGAASNYFGSGSSSQPAGYQAIPSTSYIMQYHALGLLYLIREKDRMAVTKMVQQFGGSGKGGSSGILKNPMAIVMLIRYASKVMEEDPK